MDSWRTVYDLFQTQKTISQYNSLCSQLYASEKTKVRSFVDARELLALDNKYSNAALYHTILDISKNIPMPDKCLRLACMLENELMAFYRSCHIKNIRKYATIKYNLQKIGTSGALPVDVRYITSIIMAHVLFMYATDRTGKFSNRVMLPCVALAEVAEPAREFFALLLVLNEISAFLPDEIVVVLKNGIKI